MGRSRCYTRRGVLFSFYIFCFLIFLFRLSRLCYQRLFWYLQKHRRLSKIWRHLWFCHKLRFCLKQPTEVRGCYWFCVLWLGPKRGWLRRRGQQRRRVSFVWDWLFCAIFSRLWVGRTFYPFYTCFRKRLVQIYGFRILTLLEYVLRLYRFPKIWRNVSYRHQHWLHEPIFCF